MVTSSGRGSGGTRGAETAGGEPTVEQAQQLQQQLLNTALKELSKDLGSQLDDVHDMVCKAEENTARVLAEIKADLKVGVLYTILTDPDLLFKLKKIKSLVIMDSAIASYILSVGFAHSCDASVFLQTHLKVQFKIVIIFSVINTATF